MTRIYQAALQIRPNDAGTVCVYLLTPDAQPLDVLHVARAAKPPVLIAALRGVLGRVKVTPGEPVVKPARQSAPPRAPADSLVLHLTARYLQREGDQCVPAPSAALAAVLGTGRAGNWSDLPSEDWVVLGRAEWTRLLPPGPAEVGTSWNPDPKAVARLLEHFYPPTENTDVTTNRIEQQSLRATVVARTDRQVRARLEGALKMRHRFYHKEDANYVQARLVGLLELDLAGSRVRSLRLVTDGALYGSQANRMNPFGVAVRSVP